MKNVCYLIKNSKDEYLYCNKDIGLVYRKMDGISDILNNQRSNEDIVIIKRNMGNVYDFLNNNNLINDKDLSVVKVTLKTLDNPTVFDSDNTVFILGNKDSIYLYGNDGVTKCNFMKSKSSIVDLFTTLSVSGYKLYTYKWTENVYYKYNIKYKEGDSIFAISVDLI